MLNPTCLCSCLAGRKRGAQGDAPNGTAESHFLIRANFSSTKMTGDGARSVRGTIASRPWIVGTLAKQSLSIVTPAAKSSALIGTHFINAGTLGSGESKGAAFAFFRTEGSSVSDPSDDAAGAKPIGSEPDLSFSTKLTKGSGLGGQSSLGGNAKRTSA